MKYWLYLLLVLFSVTLHAQSQGEPLPFHPEVRHGQLDNGLTFLILPNDLPEDRAELHLALRAGSLQEAEDQLGVAHFVEHMAFNGTEHFAKNELVDYLESTGMRFGPDLNAYTSFAETVYMLQVRTDSLPLLEKGMLVLEDWAGGLTFEPEEVDKERGVVISEWRSRLSAEQRLQQEYFPVLYKDSRYAQRLPIGEPELIDTVSYETIRRFYEDWYRPDLMAVIAVGDFDPDWMEAEIRRRFANLKNPGNAPARQTYPVPGHDSTLYSISTDPEAAFTRVQIIFKHPQAGEDLKTTADFRDQLLQALYNRMLNARLFEVQQQAAPPFTFAYSGYGGNVGDLETYTTYAFVQEGGAIPGIEAVLTETMRARRHGFLPSELERQKAELLRSAEKAYREQDKTRSRELVSSLSSYFLDNNPLLSAEQNLQLHREILPTISVAEINPLPRQWITKENRVVIVTGPGNEAAPLPTEAELSALLERMEQSEPAPYEDQISDAPLLPEAPSPGAVTAEETYEGLNVQEWQLANGVRVVLKPTDFRNDEIRMSAFSPGGHSLYDDEDYLSASTAAALVGLGGVGDFTLTELQKKLAGKTVGVSPYISELYEGISGSCSPDDLETMLRLTYLYFTAPRKDSTALQSYLSRQRSIFENLFSDPYYYFAKIKQEIKYDNHPRRQVTTLKDLDRISLDRAFEIYQERFADASDFTFFLVGNFEPDSIRPLLTAYLGNLPALPRKESWRDVEADLITTVDTTIVRGEAPKSVVEMIFHGNFNYDSTDNRFHYYTMADLLRRKLRERMREDQGGVYGVRVSSFATPLPEPHYRLTLSFNADPEEVDTLIAIALAEVERIQREGASEADLAKLRETQIQQRIRSLKENSFWMGQLETRYRYGIPLTGIRLEPYQEKVENLTSEDLRQAARRHLDRERYLEIVLMPAVEEGRE